MSPKGTLSTADGNETSIITMKITMRGLHKTKNITTVPYSYIIPGYMPKETKIIMSQRYLHTQLYSTIHHSQMVKSQPRHPSTDK